MKFLKIISVLVAVVVLGLLSTQIKTRRERTLPGGSSPPNCLAVVCEGERIDRRIVNRRGFPLATRDYISDTRDLTDDFRWGATPGLVLWSHFSDDLAFEGDDINRRDYPLGLIVNGALGVAVLYGVYRFVRKIRSGQSESSRN